MHLLCLWHRYIWPRIIHLYSICNAVYKVSMLKSIIAFLLCFLWKTTLNIQSQHVNCGGRYLSRVKNAYLSYVSMQMPPHRLWWCWDARGSAVGPALLISVYHPPWMTCIGNGSQLATMTWEVTPEQWRWIGLSADRKCWWELKVIGFIYHALFSNEVSSNRCAQRL